MILIFLGSWRSTLIVCTSIPLAILFSIASLSALGETINVMSLGGLALAVGMLVDDATVEIENTHRNLGAKDTPLGAAILNSAQQVAVPALVATMCICIVFVPVTLLSGAAKYIFTPLALGVVFAMIASYLLSRTLVATMMHFLLRPEVSLYQEGAAPTRRPQGPRELFGESIRPSIGNSRKFGRVITACSNGCSRIVPSLAEPSSPSLWRQSDWSPSLGRISFPTSMRVRCGCTCALPTGTRIEEAAAIFSSIESEIRRVIPAQEIDSILDNIGLPNSGINLAIATPSPTGTAMATY